MRKLIDAYLLRVEELQVRDDRFVVNDDVRRFVRKVNGTPEIIVVADNPGDKERQHREFLSEHGSAGRIARHMLEAVFGYDFLEHVLILNKSNYCTSSTSDLEKLLRNKHAHPELVGVIRADQEANGRFVRHLQRMLDIPAVVFGWKVDSLAFEPFRLGHGEIQGTVPFHGLTVQQSQVVPHPSYRRCYRPVGGDEERARRWDERVRAFLEHHKDIPGISTHSGAISEKTLRIMKNRELWWAYFTTVILGANLTTPA